MLTTLISRHGGGRRLRILTLIAAAAITGPAALAAAAQADVTVTVSTTSDAPVTGQCSLREATLLADGSAEPSCSSQTATGVTTIELPAGEYTLSSGPLSVTGTTVIDGAGIAATTISGNNASQVLNVAGGAQATVENLTLTQGRSSGNGGAVANAGVLTLSSVAITNSTAAAGNSPATRVCHAACPTGSAGAAGGTGSDGGGIYNTGQLSLDHSSISANTAGVGGTGANGVSANSTAGSAGEAGGAGGAGGRGGGLFNATAASATLTASSITGNAGGRGGNGGNGSDATDSSGNGGNGAAAGDGGNGGGIFNDGALVLTSVTLAANATGDGQAPGFYGLASGSGHDGTRGYPGAGGTGAGILADQGSVSLTNVTIADNHSVNCCGAETAAYGSAIWKWNGTFNMSFTTIAGNVADGIAGVSSVGGSAITESDSIIAGNSAANGWGNCEYGVSDTGNNLTFPDGSCPGIVADPKLGALADNGGPAQTLALGSGTGAADLVPAADCPATDERGLPRPAGQPCDAGAYQRVPPTITAVASVANTATTATVTAGVNPNLGGADTTVIVKYGTASGGLGAQTPPEDMGHGDTTIGFSASLSGLAPATTFYYEVVANSADGTTVTPIQTFITPASPSPGGATTPGATNSGATNPGATDAGGGSGVAPDRAAQLPLKIGAITVKRTIAKVVATCPAASPLKCSGTLTLRAIETIVAGKVSAVAAAAHQPAAHQPAAHQPAAHQPSAHQPAAHQAAARKRTVTLGSAAVTIVPARRKVVVIHLNAAARRLLAARRRLPSRLYVLQAGITRAGKPISFRAHVSVRSGAGPSPGRKQAE